MAQMADVHTLYDEAEALKEEGKLQEAIAKYEEALAIDEKFALAHFALAVVYGKVGEHEKAVEHGERACALDPEDAFSYTAMSVTYQRAFAGTQDRRYIQLAEEAMGKAHAMQMRQ
jgi:tetratricopeptide (TPR) repeat protein